MKKYFNKQIVGTKRDNEDFENSANCWICDIDHHIGNKFKVKDHCHITENCRGCEDCNINVKVKHTIPVVLHNLKNYDSALTMQELGKFNLKINAILNGLGTYMILSINDSLSFIDMFQFLSSPLDSSVENLAKDHFKYLSQELHNKYLNLVKKK